MITFLGIVLIVAAISMLVSALRKPEGPNPPQVRPNRTYLWTGGVGLLLGVFLLGWPAIALTRMQPKDLSRQDAWGTNPPAAPDAAVRWDGPALEATLEVGSGHYAAYPVDWKADRFEAEWDITFKQLELPGDTFPLKQGTGRRSERDFASVTVGMMDQNAANIDDRDHVSGSAIEACFSDDIRLRASDANYLVRTSSSTESGKEEIDPDFKPTDPIAIELNRKYRCRLSFDGRSRVADLVVRDEGGGEIVRRRLEDLKDFTNSVAWFGVSVRGYNRFDKKQDAKKADTGYTRPKAAVRIENMRYRQP